MLVILVAQEFRRHSGEKPKGNDADDLGCVGGWQNSFEDTFQMHRRENPKGNDVDVGDLI